MSLSYIEYSLFDLFDFNDFKDMFEFLLAVNFGDNLSKILNESFLFVTDLLDYFILFFSMKLYFSLFS